METKLTVLLLSIFLIICGSTNVKAQVTIGDGTPPQDFSVLEISTAETKGGLRLPQLTTTQRNSLSLPTISEDNKKERAKGLAIFNTETKCFEFWNSMEWISLCNGQEPGLVEFTDCDKITVTGAYDMDKPLKDQNVRIEVPVNVTKMGSYVYSAVCNGITFEGRGNFVNLGPTTVSLYIDIAGGTPTAAGTFNATVTITPVDGDPDPITVVCTSTQIKFLKRSEATLKILNLAGDQNSTGLTSTGGNYSSSSVYTAVGNWLRGASTSIVGTTLSAPRVYAGTLNVEIINVPISGEMAVLQTYIEEASIIWVGASEIHHYGAGVLINEWSKAGKGIVMITGDKAAESTVPNALGYYIEDGSSAYGSVYGSRLPEVFSSANGAPFNIGTISQGIGYSGSNCGYVSSKTGTVFMNVDGYPSAFADLSNGVFIFGDKFGSVSSGDRWNNFAKVLTDIFVWSLKNAPIH
ncbi:hypothetical protein M2451_002419 [Dysgonomonas sp. PFB1-18]|uniref:hypothetical protein n=1 Tax=unclassified Dysgonomonas TaxID=2630389 RepID=UPI0024741519|nr:MULTISPECIES: hypothetical protein [unclassified Dysgonomonas]MDH6307185.1 hypothetical protein [Dysgonomonas sp. PF1-14]MDH6337104.1 hypothetical protein [Dysgonomonas sp. PF1-16]MDH6381090.1 hypothetical protein [Dysgonomonas sp. PFB1-18]MDH6396331.1 hypothetical protein [Dysgonomonas sp. PF1-23]